MKCQNCGNEVLGNFCSSCGQRIVANHRLSWAYLGKDFSENILNFERGFIFTAYALFVRPGSTVRAYIDGRRISYSSPAKYYVIVTILISIINYIIHYQTNASIDLFVVNDTQKIMIIPEPYRVQAGIWNIKIINHYPVVAGLIRAILYPAVTYFVFRRERLNFVEHISAMFYFQATWLLILYLSLVIAVIFGFRIHIEFAYFVIWGYLLWAFYSFFVSYSVVQRIIRSLVTILIISLGWLYVVMGLSIIFG